MPSCAVLSSCRCRWRSFVAGARRAFCAGGGRRGSSGGRAAQRNAGRPAGYRSQGRRVTGFVQPCRIPGSSSRQADHDQSGAGRSAQGVRAFRSAHCTWHPGRFRQIPGNALDEYEFAGELSLSGLLRPIRGAPGDGTGELGRTGVPSCCRSRVPRKPHWLGIPAFSVRRGCSMSARIWPAVKH